MTTFPTLFDQSVGSLTSPFLLSGSVKSKNGKEKYTVSHLVPTNNYKYILDISDTFKKNLNEIH